MADFNSNAYFLSVGGTDLSARVIDVDLSQDTNAVENTNGASTTHEGNAPGLKSNKISFTLQYDDATRLTDIVLLHGTQAVIYGPEGNTGGDPKHNQSFMLSGVGVKQTVAKDNVVFSVDGVGNGAPTTDMFAGETW